MSLVINHQSSKTKTNQLLITINQGFYKAWKSRGSIFREWQSVTKQNNIRAIEKNDMSMKNGDRKVSTSRKEGSRIVKNVGIWRRNERLGSDSRKERAKLVVRIRVYWFTLRMTFVHCASRVALLLPLIRWDASIVSLFWVIEGKNRLIDLRE